MRNTLYTFLLVKAKMDHILALYAVWQQDRLGVWLYATVWPSGRKKLVTLVDKAVYGATVGSLMPSDMVVITRDTCNELPLNTSQKLLVVSWLNSRKGTYRASPTMS